MERGSGANAECPGSDLAKLRLIPEKEYPETLKIGEENL